MGLEILAYGKRVRVVEADFIRIRFLATFEFCTYFQPGPPNTWTYSGSSCQVWGSMNGSGSEEFTIPVVKGQILRGFILVAGIHSGRLIVEEVRLESTSGVRIDLEP